MTDKKSNKMAVMSRGVLDDISKPPSAASQRAGSRASQDNNMAASKPRQSSMDGRLQYLTPEQIMRSEFDLELEEYGSHSEYTDDDDDDGKSNINTVRTSEMFHIAEPVANQPYPEDTAGLLLHHGDNDEDLHRQLTLFSSLDSQTEISVDSDEERSIIREIRAEITQQVREEMKDELAVYQKKREKLESRGEGEPDKKKEDAEDIDPELKEAIIKMRKLDRILAKKIQKEKSVKRDRILLQRRLKAELENLKPEGREESRDVKTNTQKFLALTLPPSHNTGVEVNDVEPGDEESPPVTPVFQTQVMDDMLHSTQRNQAMHSGTPSSSGQGDQTPHGSEASMGTSLGNSTSLGGSMSSSRNGGHHKRSAKDKDFIKRNMQLAADAGSAIAMTDDEKKRIEDLLANLETLPEIPEDDSVTGDTPYQVALCPGDGFVPEITESERMEAIDTRLRALLPAEDYEAITNTSRSTTQQTTQLFTRTTVLAENVEDLPGERPLLENKEQRELRSRLADIEQELERLSSAVEMEIEDPHLSNDQLQDLLDQCARTISRTTAETDSLSQSSRSSVTMSRQSLIENPPKLADDVLQKLLTEARQELAISAPSTSRTSDTQPDQVENVVLESMSEENLKQLLQDSRTTSRAMLSRSASRPGSARSHPPEGAVTNGYHDSRTSSQMSDYLSNRSSSQMSDKNSAPKRPSSQQERVPFLPEIDPKGTVSTARQGGVRLNNEDSGLSRPPSGGRLSAVTVRNTFTPPNHNLVLQSCDSETDFMPRPPSGGRKTNSAGKNRTESPKH